jgi:hypothetical protein
MVNCHVLSNMVYIWSLGLWRGFLDDGEVFDYNNGPKTQESLQ